MSRAKQPEPMGELEAGLIALLTDRAEFDAMLARSQERLHAAIGAAREALGPNAGIEPHLPAPEER